MSLGGPLAQLGKGTFGGSLPTRRFLVASFR